MAIERMAEEKFAQIMGRVLSPSRAIESPELLKGRDDQLREIRTAPCAPARKTTNGIWS